MTPVKLVVLSFMGIVGNIIAGFFIPLAGAIIKVPLAMLLIVIGKAVADPLPNGASFVIGVLQDAFGYVVAIWLVNMMMLRFVGTSVAWLLLILLSAIIPWLSWSRMMNTSVATTIRWHEIGCNVGRVCGLIVGGLLFL
jgi:hypothetical protein